MRERSLTTRKDARDFVRMSTLDHLRRASMCLKHGLYRAAEDHIDAAAVKIINPILEDAA